MPEVTLGGERLGSGNKNKQYLHNYERSSHDIGYIWRSTMSAGTLVPFMSELALPGDTFDIDLDCDVLTHPTIGPLFGSYKIQLDVFQVPIRLYQPKLHMNQLGIGLDMSNVFLPVVKIPAPSIDVNQPVDNQQMNPSAIFSYLGIRGCGFTTGNAPSFRNFNAIPYLAYFDIYKSYYANKQEGIGLIIHKDVLGNDAVLDSVMLADQVATTELPSQTTTPKITWTIGDSSSVLFVFTTYNPLWDPKDAKLHYVEDGQAKEIAFSDIFNLWSYDENNNQVRGTSPKFYKVYTADFYSYVASQTIPKDSPPTLATFALNNIDTMRMNILQSTDAQYIIDDQTIAPYSLPLSSHDSLYSQLYSQEGLAVKTYQSDLFNNWICTDWIDGVGGINDITAIQITDDSFTVNELMLSKKIYDMLMRIAVSGGTYDDWLDAVYTHDRQRSAESPMYIGGLIKNLVFQEVISTAPTESKPLGTLAGRGKLGSKNKGGHIVAKIDEPSYLIGIISLTPMLDYSQGNKWDVNLNTLDDLHKPGLDQIGFQELITDQMAWFDTGLGVDGMVTTKSAGKVPAWINYMTNVNQVRGNFADETQQGFMVLNRQYLAKWQDDALSCGDITTYIDPSKFNHIFADTRLDAQNFWSQIKVDITARRKISAKTIPNL